jgi:hypothetical protein
MSGAAGRVLPEGIIDMDGPSLVPVVIPILVVISLVAWLTMIYYADSPPARTNSPELPHGSSGASATDDQRPHNAFPADTAATGPVEGVRPASDPRAAVPPEPGEEQAHR